MLGISEFGNVLMSDRAALIAWRKRERESTGSKKVLYRQMSSGWIWEGRSEQRSM